MDWEDLEALYWRFDAMHRGYGAWEGRPTSERDAFKRTVKQALAEKDTAYQQLMDKAIAFAQSMIYVMGALVSTREQLKANGLVTASRKFLGSPEVQAFLKEREVE